LKKIATLGTISLVLVSCATAANSKELSYKNIGSGEVSPNITIIDIAIEKTQQQTLELELQKIAAEGRIKEANDIRIKDNQWVVLEYQKNIIQGSVNELIRYDGKTKYVFSGSTPNGWDCSGLVKWFYLQLDYEVPHSASAQSNLGTVVDKPKPGDIVAFREPGRRGFHHTAIYIGDNRIIHAGWRPGHGTEILSLDSNYFAKTEIKFLRLIQSN
jgi:cell wall-associated NlpC family hydrolase